MQWHDRCFAVFFFSFSLSFVDQGPGWKRGGAGWRREGKTSEMEHWLVVRGICSCLMWNYSYEVITFDLTQVDVAYFIS